MCPVAIDRPGTEPTNYADMATWVNRPVRPATIFHTLSANLET